MQETKIILNYEFENLNEIIRQSRANYYGANNRKKQEMRYVKLATLKVPKITEYPIKATFIWHVKDKNRDIDNMVAKNILDGLVQAKILKNDNLNCINEISYKAVVDKEQKVEIILTKN